MNAEHQGLNVRNVTAGYGDLRVLFDVTLTAKAGAVTALLGSNGAGKTTLLSTVAGLVRVKQGSVSLGNRDITHVAAHARSKAGIALVQEGKRVFRRRSVEQNLLLGGYLLTGRERSSAIERAYAQFPVLRDKRKSPAGSLSGGQQQMLAVAQAMMTDPKVLMLDEPSAGLAPILVNEIMEVVRSLKAGGTAVVLVEQLVGTALSVADHVVVLQEGRVVVDQPAALVMEADLRDAYLGGHRRGRAPEISDTPVSSGAPRTRQDS